jgi:hypothetical protein
LRVVRGFDCPVRALGLRTGNRRRIEGWRAHAAQPT